MLTGDLKNLEFLDIKLIIDSNNKIRTNAYTKPTNSLLMFYLVLATIRKT